MLRVSIYVMLYLLVGTAYVLVMTKALLKATRTAGVSENTHRVAQGLLMVAWPVVMLFDGFFCVRAWVIWRFGKDQ